MNTLLIDDPDKFDEDVWQSKTDFDEEDYTEWMREATQTLQNIYDEYEGKADVYILGDVINMLSTVKVVLTGKHK